MVEMKSHRAISKTKISNKNIISNERLFILTDVLWGATCAPVLIPLMELVGQAKVNEFDVGVR